MVDPSNFYPCDVITALVSLITSDGGRWIVKRSILPSILPVFLTRQRVRAVFPCIERAYHTDVGISAYREL